MEIKNRADFGTIIPAYLDDYPLTMAEFRLYAHVSRRAGGGYCWESIPNLAKCCRMNVKTCRKAISGLLEKRLIEKTVRKGKTTVYTLTDPSEWLPPEECGGLVQLTPTKSGSTKSGSTKSGRGGHTTPTKLGTPPLPNQVVPPLPNLVDEGIPIKELKEGKEEREEKRPGNADAGNADAGNVREGIALSEKMPGSEPDPESASKSLSGEVQKTRIGSFSETSPDKKIPVLVKNSGSSPERGSDPAALNNTSTHPYPRKHQGTDEPPDFDNAFLNGRRDRRVFIQKRANSAKANAQIWTVEESDDFFRLAVTHFMLLNPKRTQGEAMGVIDGWVQQINRQEVRSPQAREYLRLYREGSLGQTKAVTAQKINNEKAFEEAFASMDASLFD